MAIPVRSYEDLRVWHLGIELAEDVFHHTRSFPRDGWALANQMRSAAVSIPSNVAEGWGRGSRRDFLRFLMISRGSLYELRTQSEIARRVGFVSAETAAQLVGRVNVLSRMLHAYIRSLQARA